MYFSSKSGVDGFIERLLTGKPKELSGFTLATAKRKAKAKGLDQNVSTHAEPTAFEEFDAMDECIRFKAED